MCVKILRSGVSSEFNPSEPLEYQAWGAEKIVVNYNPVDPTIGNVDLFIGEMERLCKTGISCNVDIQFNANNNLNGLRIERKLEKLKEKLDINELVKKLVMGHDECQRKLRELSSMCAEKSNE